MDPVDAGTWMMLITAGFCVLVALVLQIGLKGGVPAIHGQTERVPLSQLLKVGFSAMRNPRIALSYAAAFTSRGDLVVVGVFVSLWAVQAGTAMGLETSEAQKRGVQVFAISQTMALLWSPVMGWLMDKVNRVTAIAIAMVLASIGYLSTMFLKSPIEGAGMIVFIILAIGQVSALITSQGLIGQESPPKERGAVVGMFTLWGGVGILFATWAGGRLFDSWAPYAPFVIMGVANIILLVAAVIIRIKSPGLNVKSTPPIG